MELCFYDERFQTAVENYHLTLEQLRFTGTPKDSIVLSKEDPDRYPILAMDDNKLVTFFVLHKNEGIKPYTENTKAILIRAFSTDSRYQGKGYAKKALRLLPTFLNEHLSDTSEMVLAVNVKNKAAQELYKKCGFIDEGVRRMGDKGELIIMSYYL
jgi:RimJ/RimL family protein N-acetyltransferase